MRSRACWVRWSWIAEKFSANWIGSRATAWRRGSPPPRGGSRRTRESRRMAPFQRYVMRFQTLTHHAEQSARACAIMLGFAIPVSVALDNLLLAVTLGLWLVAADYRAKLATIGSNRVALAA